ncbi:MAG TPA: DUF2071 domain-containing protein [Cryptosporangiaceae bacterium]|nr:DUF2071 domain-containing protein [Cryptosporangiaceae bacterium]
MDAPPPPEIPRPVMYQHWLHMTFLHWRYPAEVVQPLLPAGLTVQTCDGSAWVGLLPFLIDRVRAPGVPALPWLSRFPETNVRTYVRDPSGRAGIWFFSLDVTRLPAMLSARAGYGLPYYWSKMTVRRAGRRLSYRSARRWPGPAGARCVADVEVGDALAGPERDELAHFLTARFRLYTVIAGRLATALAAHPDWPLRHARVMHLEQDLVQAGGLPEPGGSPHVLASPGVATRISRWAWV